MANEENLIKSSDLTSSELRERARKGGQASAKARREKKTFKETLEVVLSMPLYDGDSKDIEAIQSVAAAKGSNMTAQEAIMISIARKAMRGDVKAAEYIRDTIGQKPMEKVEISKSIDETVREMNEYFNEKAEGNKQSSD